MPGILVVEDDENLNRGIAFSLKKSGYEVFSAESVKKAKRIASDNNVDVTICDVNLPDGHTAAILSVAATSIPLPKASSSVCISATMQR